MATQVQFRRGTTSQNNAFAGAQGELTIDTEQWTIRIHDGTTPGGKQVPTLTATQTFTNKTMSTNSVWNGNAVGLGYGGTGAALSAVAGAIAYSTGSAIQLSAAGTSGQGYAGGNVIGTTYGGAGGGGGYSGPEIPLGKGETASANRVYSGLVQRGFTKEEAAAITGNIISSQITNVGNYAIVGTITSNQLANTGITAGVYGGASNAASITVDAQGRVTSVANVAWTSTSITGGFSNMQVFTANGTFTVPSGISKVKVYVTGGGGGGGNNDVGAGSPGGTSSFGPHCSATGGSGGYASDGNHPLTGGGSGSNGDLNLQGLPGTGAAAGNYNQPGMGGASYWGRPYGYGGDTYGNGGAGGGGLAGGQPRPLGGAAQQPAAALRGTLHR